MENLFDNEKTVLSDLKGILDEVFDPVDEVSLKPPVPFTDDPIEFITSKDYMGIPLFDKQAYIIEKFTERDENGKRKYNTLILIAGMRSGKTSLAALYALFVLQKLLKLEDPQSYFRQIPGQLIYILNVATSNKQALDTIYNRMVELMRRSDWWQEYINWLKKLEAVENNPGSLLKWSEGKQPYILFRHKNIRVESMPSSAPAIAGRTAYLVMFDEICWLRRESESKSRARSAENIWETLTSRVANLDGEVLVVSSPVHQEDFGMYLLTHAGTLYTGEVGEQYIKPLWMKVPEDKKVSTWVGFHYTTFEFNPNETEDKAFYRSKKQSDPIGFMRDFYAVPPASTNPFFPYPEVIDSCVDENIPPVVSTDIAEVISPSGLHMVYLKFVGLLRRPEGRIIIGIDAGNKEDAFVIGIAHTEPLPISYGMGRYKVIVDQLLGVEPDKSVRQVVYQDGMWELVLNLVELLSPEVVVMDDWQSVLIQQQLDLRGIKTSTIHSDYKSYSELRARIHSGMIKFPKGKHIRELKQLELFSGNKVDHPPSGSKDYADVIARIAYYVGTTEGLLSDGDEAPLSTELISGASFKGPDPVVSAVTAQVKQRAETYKKQVIDREIELPKYPGLDRLSKISAADMPINLGGMRIFDPFAVVFGKGMYTKKPKTR